MVKVVEIKTKVPGGKRYRVTGPKGLNVDTVFALPQLPKVGMIMPDRKRRCKSVSVKASPGLPGIFTVDCEFELI